MSILVVDDSPTVRRAVAKHLGSRGLRVLEAQDGAQALAIAASESVRLVLMDSVLGGENGVDVCRKLETIANMESVPILVLSGKEETVWEQCSGLQAVIGILAKPFEPAALIAMVEHELRRARRKTTFSPIQKGALSQQLELSETTDDRLQRQLQAQLEETARLERLLASSSTLVSQENQKHCHALESARAEADAAREAESALKNERAALVSRLQVLEAQLSQSSVDTNRLRELSSALEGECTLLRAQNQELNEQGNVLASEWESLVSKVTSLEDALDQLRSRFKKLVQVVQNSGKKTVVIK